MNGKPITVLCVVAGCLAHQLAGGVDAAAARTECKSRACNERVAKRKCSQEAPRWCVKRVIFQKLLTGGDAAWMMRTPGCESGWNPYAQNPSGSSGLYQFLPSTWETTPYARRSIWSAKWQAFAAWWMRKQGRSGEWVCR
jgi:Transglycosylase SLT domain